MSRRGIMLFSPFEEKRLAKWKPPYIVQPKYDGDRCRNLPLQNTPMLLTSEENPYFSVPHINKQLINTGHFRIPLDGELYNHNLFLEGGHELIHSIASRTINLHPRHKELDFVIFDIQQSDILQMERIINLVAISKSFGVNIKLAPFWICNTLNEIKKIYDKLVKMKYEGIVIRHLQGTYLIREGKAPRTTFGMKFKPKQKDTYKIVGYKEEHTIDGIPKGIVGSIICSSNDGDEFGVSAGLDNQQRWELWQVRDKIAGCMATIHYQHLTNKKIPKGSFDIQIPELGIV